MHEIYKIIIILIVIIISMFKFIYGRNEIKKYIYLINMNKEFILISYIEENDSRLEESK